MNASSSSLAMALSEPIIKKKKAPPKVYKAEESAGFFNDFLSQQSAELKSPKTPGIDRTPRKRTKEHSEGSPDLHGHVPATPQSSRKRKAAQALESPTAKRGAAQQAHQNGTGVFALQTSQARAASPVRVTPTPRMKLEPYIAMPPIPKVYQTPMHNKGKMRVGSEEDRDGFVDSDESPTKWRSTGFDDSVKSPTKRTTGDRDDRGDYMLFVTC